MAHGTADWAGRRLETVYTFSGDLAELAVRLSSIVSYDRGGRVRWLDDFNKGIGAWQQETYGTGADIVVSPSYPKSPPFCARLTAGSTDIHAAVISRYVAPHPLTTLGVEASIAFLSRFDHFIANIYYYTGTEYYQAAIQLDDDDRKIKYQDDAAAWQTLDDIPDLALTYGLYHSFKFTVDLENLKYIRCLFNENSYDMSTYGLYTFASTSGPYILVRLYFSGRSGENDICHIDNVILTQDEV